MIVEHKSTSVIMQVGKGGAKNMIAFKIYMVDMQ